MSKQEMEQAGTSGWIVVEGAREHNLKDLTVALPRGRFVVITGVSGSGKSTLAFDILFAEGQRRFLDCLGAYARQFVEELPRPDVDRIVGLPPTVSIEQRTSQGGGKSTVATVTEIYHFLRLLYARLGTPWCPNCQVPVQPLSKAQLIQQLAQETRKRGPLVLLAPLVRGRKGYHYEVLDRAEAMGIQRLRVDGRMVQVGEELIRLDRYKEHWIEAVIGEVTPSDFLSEKKRWVRRLVEETLLLGKGILLALDQSGRVTTHSTESACPQCGFSLPPLEPKLFSYNSPAGWCPECRGFGVRFYLPEGVDRGARAEAIEESWYEWAEGEREVCPSCGGTRLNAVARSVRLRLPGWNRDWTIVDVCRLPVTDALRLFQKVRLKGRAKLIAQDILPEIIERLQFLCDVGLDYLQLDRGVPTLSGGEAQRIRLAAQLGSTLTGVLYVLDEPTIGLHPRDSERLLNVLDRLRRRGNSILVVEHDEATIRRAEYIIDLGPGAGVEGGRVVVSGPLKEVLQHPESVTARYLREPRKHPIRGRRRPVGRPPRLDRLTSAQSSPRNGAVEWLILEGARMHNLKNLTLRIPLGRFVVITGVSGSGKSTLARDCLLTALRAALRKESAPPEAGRIVAGADRIRAVHEVDQSPIGRTPRSVPATYVKLFDEIRRLFAQLPEARLRGYGPGRFSFNTAEGRCPECQGVGMVKLQMSFLPPAFVTCPRCGGRRFLPETLEVRFQGKSIADVLDLSVSEAREFFAQQPRIRRVLDAMYDTGLGYLKLGQPSPTLSGGEAQRIKLISHLVSGNDRIDAIRKPRSRNFFLLEEPTIGLHTQDVLMLVEVLQRLVDRGHTVVVIEHNLDLIAEADWVIDLGPESGEKGGRIVVEGPPEKVARSRRSYTGRFLREFLRLDA